MDAVTAISGSGPAYFYLLMEIMENCAIEMGLPKSLAEVLTRQTGLGAGRVAVESDLDLKQLREKRNVQGRHNCRRDRGPRAGKIRDIVAKALVAARDRSVELGASPSAD